MTRTTAWLWLFAAGGCEIVYALLMPHTRAFTRPIPSVAAAVFIMASMYGLSVAAREVPIGTAYAVWVGIGAAGTALAGILFLGESRDFWRIASLLAVIAGVVGLRLTAR